MFTATHLHAMIIHFPIALLMVGFLSEVIALFSKKEFFKNATLYLLLLGALGTAAAYLSGNYAGEGIEDGPLEAPMEQHEQGALISLWLAIVTAFFRVAILYFKINLQWAKWVGILLFAGLISSIAWTGYLGGQLVYRHGAGVELTLPGINTESKEED